MEREIWIRGAMFSTVVVLALLILVTPGLQGHPAPLASLPVLIVAMTPDKSSLVIDVAAGVSPYLYRNVTLSVTPQGVGNASGSSTTTGGNWTYGASFRIRGNGTSGLPGNGTQFLIHLRLVDRDGNLFEDNVTVKTSTVSNGGVEMLFSFPDGQSAGTITRTTPDDFRWAIPRRGTVPGTV
jgi:hypothetical protein